MSEVSISSKAFAKIIFHAAKYPHLAVNGLLLSDKHDKSKSPTIVEAIPLFHQCLHVTPMAEIALIQVEARVAQEDLQIAGYYAAAENYYDSSLERTPGMKIAEKIAELNSSAIIALVDNKAVTMEMQYPALKLFQTVDSKWTKIKYNLHSSQFTLDAVSHLLGQGAMKQLIDFDNYLDNPENDWTNAELNRNLDKILDMDDEDDDQD